MTKLAAWTAITLSTLVLSITIGLDSTLKQTRAVAADPAPPDTQLKALFSEKCSACHDLPDPVAHGFTRQEWTSTVNRMLNAHNARTSISDDQASQIIDYLSQFAPKPVADNGSNGIGVWQYDPVISVSYPFTYAPNLSDFDIRGGAWRVIETPDIASGYLKHVSAGGTDILLENKNSFVGGLDIQTEFRIIKFISAASVGLTFGSTDARNYYAAEFSPTTGSISLIKVVDGQLSTLQTTAPAATAGSTNDEWHTLRVKVTENGTALEVQLDYNRVLKIALPGGVTGHIGLISDGAVSADFRQLTADSYQSSIKQPSGDVLLH